MQAGTNDNGDSYMSHIFRLSDEQYDRLAAYAARRKQTPEKLFQAWVREVTNKTKEPVPLNRKEEHGEELQSHPLLDVAGMFAIGEPGWADKHDEYLAETYLEKHDHV
jgi:hypothetical protein